jgi:integrase
VSPVHIRTRILSGGRTAGQRRYDVKYRLGGRGFRLLHGGSFRTVKEAQLRRDMIAGELAAGRDPRVLLARLANPPVPRTFVSVFDEWVATRIDVTAKTLAGYRNARARLGGLAALDPGEVSVAGLQMWVSENGDLSPGTVAVYLGAYRQALDHADVVPNPARSPKLRLPAGVDEETQPPSQEEWAAILSTIRERSRLIVRLIECDALRVSEATELQYGDVDFAEGRIRVSAARTKGRRGRRRPRWVPVPGELLDAVADLCPLEDRTRERRVFPKVTDSIVRHDVERACRDAGIAHYHPHDLRHRRVSLWTLHGIDAITVKTWAGHAKASMSLDVYGHVIVPGQDEWRGFWLDAYARERRLAASNRGTGDAPVIHETEDRGGNPHE